MSFQDAFDSVIMIIVIVHLFTIDKKSFYLIQKQLKSAKKREKIIYLYKSIKIDFCITLKILSKFQEFK